MFRTLLSGKIHRAKVTGADLDYVGSITIDCMLMKAAGIVAHERVQVVDLNNGARLETYVMPGEPDSGTIQLNGAAAHLVDIGDRLIIMSYAQVDDEESGDWEPTVVLVDEENRVVEIRNGVKQKVLAGGC
jgi:aspartate 1-decarboxylase